jgi:hypothetical protein
MITEFGFEHDHWKDNLNKADRLAMRFPSAGASVSIGELSRGSFLPCTITESSEILVSTDYAYDLALGRICRADAMQAYVRFFQTVAEHHEVANLLGLEQVYNRVISACVCGIPQARMAQDMSNLRTYWLPRLYKKEVCS